MNDVQPHTLILIRHAKASRDAVSDRERPLTDRGVRMAQDLGRQLAARLGEVDLMLVSPATRAQQTADAIAGHLPAARHSTREEIYTSGPGGWLTVLQEVPQEAARVVVVGHEPTVSALGYGLHAHSAWGGTGAVESTAAGMAERGGKEAAHSLKRGGERGEERGDWHGDEYDDRRGDALARQIAFGVSTATAVVLTVTCPWSHLAPGAARLSEVIVAQR